MSTTVRSLFLSVSFSVILASCDLFNKSNSPQFPTKSPLSTGLHAVYEAEFDVPGQGMEHLTREYYNIGSCSDFKIQGVDLSGSGTLYKNVDQMTLNYGELWAPGDTLLMHSKPKVTYIFEEGVYTRSDFTDIDLDADTIYVKEMENYEVNNEKRDIIRMHRVVYDMDEDNPQLLFEETIYLSDRGGELLESTNYLTDVRGKLNLQELQTDALPDTFQLQRPPECN